ncbi:hypothetical protein GOODEAATRI_016466 [Goodea atripinnis]|uniref:Endonuclease/exonuclease/phosphatase domain-containing protein n=1 Tax=Goodea atripinnis TaxID=208336 RepID=A0ABV0MSK7_9TELE
MQDQSGEMKERLKEPVTKEDSPSPNMDEEPLSAGLQDRRKDAAPEMTEVESAEVFSPPWSFPAASYYTTVEPTVPFEGYTCVYQRRTGKKTDGCAICYQSTCFTEAAVSKLEFFRPETKLLDRHNVGIVLLLRPLVATGAELKEAGPPLCVANTHLLFNPRRGDVKLAQLAIMLAEIDAMIKSCKARGEHCNIVFCGDFNAIPYMPLYQLVTTGELYYQGIPTWMVRKQN